MENSKQPAFPRLKQILGSGEDYHEIPATNGITKLEYFLIHSTWEPNKMDIERHAQNDRAKNPNNEPNKPPIRTWNQIIIALKIEYAKEILKQTAQ